MLLGYVKHRPDFRFSRGRDLERWTLECFIEGQIVVRTAHGEHSCEAPCVQLIPPHTAYTERMGPDGRWTERFVVFEPAPHWHTLLAWPLCANGLGYLHLSNSPVAGEVEATLRWAYQTHRSARVNRDALVVNALERVLLALDEVNPARGNAMRDARIEQVLEFIASHYTSALDLETLARSVYLSPSRLAHLFKTQMKQSPMQYVEQYRLERAAERLLSGDDSVERIALEVGYPNAFHFSTRFRRRFGQSPRRYRGNPVKV